MIDFVDAQFEVAGWRRSDAAKAHGAPIEVGCFQRALLVVSYRRLRDCVHKTTLCLAQICYLSHNSYGSVVEPQQSVLPASLIPNVVSRKGAA